MLLLLQLKQVIDEIHSAQSNENDGQTYKFNVIYSAGNTANLKMGLIQKHQEIYSSLSIFHLFA